MYLQITKGKCIRHLRPENLEVWYSQSHFSRDPGIFHKCLQNEWKKSLYLLKESFAACHGSSYRQTHETEPQRSLQVLNFLVATEVSIPGQPGLYFRILPHKKNIFTSNISNTPDAADKYDYASMHTSTVKILRWSFFPSTCAFLQQNTEIITICFPREMILINIPSKHANHPAPQKWIQFISGKLFPFP